jgi:hypothetical protein
VSVLRFARIVAVALDGGGDGGNVSCCLVPTQKSSPATGYSAT